MPANSLGISGAGVPLLTAWGASPDADLVFRLLVEHGPRGAETIRRELDMSRHRVRHALDELVDVGAVRPGADSGTRVWTPGRPDVVVAALRRRQEQTAQHMLEVRARVATLSELDTDLRLDPDARMAVRALHGLSRVRSRLTELTSTTRCEHLSMHPEPAFVRPAVQASASLDYDLLVRKVSVKCLGVPPAIDDVTAAHTLDLTNRGLLYRELPALPTKMILFDRRTAVLPLDPSDPARGALEITAPSAVDRLAGWFLRRWDAAHPPAPAATPAQLTPRERHILALLAAGHTDASAAAWLGLGERTVAYAVRDVMQRFRVQNRFQLGLVVGAHLSVRVKERS